MATSDSPQSQAKIECPHMTGDNACAVCENLEGMLKYADALERLVRSAIAELQPHTDTYRIGQTEPYRAAWRALCDLTACETKRKKR